MIQGRGNTMAVTQPNTNGKKTRKKRSPITPEHRAAMTQGKHQGAAVRNYLALLEVVDGSGAGDLDKLRERADALEARLTEEKDPIKRLDAAQQLVGLRDKIKKTEAVEKFKETEAAFIAVAAAYSERKQLTREAWQIMGVSQEVLNQAGIDVRPLRGRPRKGTKEEERVLQSA